MRWCECAAALLVRLCGFCVFCEFCVEFVGVLGRGFSWGGGVARIRGGWEEVGSKLISVRLFLREKGEAWREPGTWFSLFEATRDWLRSCSVAM